VSGARARHPPRRSLSYLGVGLVALAAVGLVLARGAVPVLAALAVLFVGGGLVRAGASATARAPVTGEGGSAPVVARRGRPGPALWAASGALAAGVLVSYWLLRADAAHGGHQTWPIYSFAGFALAGAVVWPVLTAKLRKR
jgi:hypothetical protein